MTSYNTKTGIEMEIDGVSIKIDGISTKLFNSLSKVTRKSNELVKKVMDEPNQSEDEIMKDQEEMGQMCIEFLSEVLDEEAYQKLVIDRMEDLFYLIDITTFILKEIKKAKEERLLKLLKQSDKSLS